MKQAASIFNDVLGPIMTGPSSSHTAGPCRIGLVGHQLCLGAEPTSLEIRFDRKGSFAASYNLQGTDRGLVGGLVGGRLFHRVSVTWLRGLFAAFLLYGGVRYIL